MFSLLKLGLDVMIDPGRGKSAQGALQDAKQVHTARAEHRRNAQACYQSRLRKALFPSPRKSPAGASLLEEGTPPQAGGLQKKIYGHGRQRNGVGERRTDRWRTAQRRGDRCSQPGRHHLV